MNRAVVLSALFMMFVSFLIHEPCRNSNYTDSQFTSFCYSDIPVFFAAKELPTDIAPVTQLIMILIEKLPGGFLSHTILFQLLLSACFVAIAVLFTKFPAQTSKTGVIFAFIPLWAITAFINSELISLLLVTLSIYLFYARRLSLSALASGAAIASGGWAWVVAFAIAIQLHKYAATKNLTKFVLITAVTAFSFNLPRIFTEQPLLTFDDNYGDGTPLYIWSLISEQGSPEGLITIWLGLALIVFVARWAAASFFDYRVELLALTFVCIQVLTDTSISPQSLTHVLFLLILAFPKPSYLLKMTLPMMIYVGAVWMNYEADIGTRGIHPINYAVFSVILWIVIITIGFKAADYMSVPGDDEVLASRNFQVIP